jgi:hypothetical protein
MSGQEEKQVSQGPAIKEATWQGATLASAVIALAIVGFYAFYTFGAATPEVMVQRAQAFTPFGACLLAFVTFCAAMWRGMLTTRQANEQRRQNDANEEVNLGKVLQEGAKLIGDKDNEAHRLAGIASLATLFSDPKGRFGVDAMDILASFINFSHDNKEMARSFNACVKAMHRGDAAGFCSNMSIEFSSKSSDTSWVYVPGLKGCQFYGGRISGENVNKITRKNPHSEFDGVDIFFDKIDYRATFSDCNFTECKFTEIGYDTIEQNTFIDCDFSSCIFYPTFPYDDLSFSNNSSSNYYEIGKRPVFADAKTHSAFMTKFRIIGEFKT